MEVMNKIINFKDLKIEPSNKYHIFEWNGKEIHVLDNISSNDKYDLIMITLQKSFEDGYYNPMKLDIYFHLNLIYVFTNIVFDDEDKEDEFNLYDKLIESNFMDNFLKTMTEEVYTELLNTLQEVVNVKTHYNATTASIVKKLIDDLPANAEAAQQIVDNFDPSKYQAVVDFAKAANGGRNI